MRLFDQPVSKITSCLIFLLTIFSLVITPNMASAQTVVLPPTFSHQRGFYTSSFALTLTAAGGTTIRYTLDGSIPKTTSTQYTSPINITTTSIVRAAAFSGATSSAVVTHSYIFLAAVRNQSATAPAGWPLQFAAGDSNSSNQPYPADYEMDPEVWNHPNNTNKFNQVMTSIPTLSVVTDLPNLWNSNYGIYWNSSAKDPPVTDPLATKWERPTSVELINADGSPGFAINAGMRIHGQASRRPQRTPKKSFRLYFKASYGTGKLDFQLFNDAGAVGNFDRLVLRNGGNRSWPYFDRDQRREADYVNDEWARQAWEEMGHLSSHGTYVHLYLDGLYWGLYNIAERIDEKFLAAYHPGLTELDFDLIESEEELDDAAVASAGTIDAYNELLGLVRANEVNPPAVTNAEYDVIKTKVDVNDLADYFILNHYIGKTDWPDHNWNLYRARIGADTRFKFVAWDNDSGLNKVTQNTTLMPETPINGYLDAPIQIFNRLTTNAEFRQVLIDRFYKHVVDPTGVLAPASCNAIYTELTGIVDQAVIAESARWGDYMRDVYPRTGMVADKPFPAYLNSRDLPNSYTEIPSDPVADADQKTWEQVRSEKLATYCPNRGNIVKSQYNVNDWYPYDTAAGTLFVPNISQRGGTLPTNNPNISLNNASNNNTGDIYYTTNGTDPRTEYGSVAIAAINASDSVSIPVSRAMTLKARVRNGAAWSPLLEYDFALTQSMANLVVNEIHYNPAVAVTVPAQDPKQYEFIELYNSGTTPLQLDRVAFSRGITYAFPANKDIQPGEYLVLASNATIFQQRYGFAPYAVYTGSLANEGESVELIDAVGTAFERVDYKVVAPWPITPNGTGPSLSLKSPTFDNTVAGNWAPSNVADVNGTPGRYNFNSTGPQVPSIFWTTPADIVYGTALGATQLNAIAKSGAQTISGSYSYDPPSGTVLNAGYNQLLKVTFTPNDTNTYAPSTATVQINVLKAALTITADNKTWQKSTPFPVLTVTYSGLVNNDTGANLDTAPTVNTTATEASPDGTYPISATNALDTNYEISYVEGLFTVTTKAIPTLTWANPAAISYGTPLSATQLNATVSNAIPGTFTYNPPLGTVLNAGNNQVLSVVFTPNDTTTYSTASTSVIINVSKAPLTIQAENKAKKLGAENPPLTALYLGFVNGDTITSLDVPAQLYTTATQSSSLGEYPIIVEGASDANYSITYIHGTLEISATPFRLMLPLVIK